jgi:hypothetical protein
MKATLSFSLPEEKVDHLDALNGTQWKIAVNELDQLLRNWLKHGCPHSKVEAALGDLRQRLHEDLQSRGLTMD